MIDFNTFELDRFSKLIWSLKDYTNNNLRYPKAGELVEIAYDVYSKGQLKRVNLPGVDLIGVDGKTYESKVTQFANKSQRAVRGLILKNRRQAGVYKDKLADILLLPMSKKARHVVSHLHIFTISVCVTANADPDIEDFFLNCYEQENGKKRLFCRGRRF